jgi:hypothetical protein
MTPRTHVDRRRQVPDAREFPRGTVSQAELAGETPVRIVSLTISNGADKRPSQKTVLVTQDRCGSACSTAGR